MRIDNKGSMKRAFFVFVLFFLFSSHGISETVSPSGWRKVKEVDYEHGWRKDVYPDTWRYFKNEFPKPYLAEADFNGDGLKDEAWLLIRTSGKIWGLFVFFKRADFSVHVVKVWETEGLNYLYRTGISIVEPGSYKTACALGYGDPCQEGEPKLIEIKFPGINLFEFESRSSLIYWEPDSKKFRMVATSD
jgi:hypothetical protein